MSEPMFYLHNRGKYYVSREEFLPGTYHYTKKKKKARQFSQKEANDYKETHQNVDWITIPVISPEEIESFNTLKTPKKVTEKEQINSPEHYTAGGLEVIEILRQKLTAEEFK